MSQLKPIGVLLLLIGLLPLSVFAQDDEDRAAVLQAFENLATNGNFQFTLKATTVTVYTDASGQDYTNINIYSSTGEVAPNGDYQDTLKVQGGTTLGEARDGDPLQLGRIVIGDQIYLSLQYNDSAALEELGIDSGWWRYNDFIDALEGADEAEAINVLLNYPVPSKFHTNDDTVATATLSATEEVNQVEMRVFDVEMNALALLLAQNPNPGLTLFAQMLKDTRLLASSELSAHNQYWIGADDGRLYAGTGESHLLFPYLTLGREDSPPYDIDTTTTSEFSLTYPDEPIEITAPDESLLDH